MPLVNRNNIRGGLEMCQTRLLYLRDRFHYIMKHEVPSIEREAMLDVMEQEVDDLCDSVNVLLSLKKEF